MENAQRIQNFIVKEQCVYLKDLISEVKGGGEQEDVSALPPWTKAREKLRRKLAGLLKGQRQ